MAEGVHIFNTDKEEALKVMAKYTKVTDRKVLQNSYSDNSGVHSPTLEPTRSGIANILETLAGTAPKAATAKPEDFIDPRLVKKLEESGFFKNSRADRERVDHLASGFPWIFLICHKPYFPTSKATSKPVKRARITD
jgi:hypothetical protein